MAEETPEGQLAFARNLARTDCQCVWLLEDGSVTMRAPGPEAGNYLCVWPSGEVTATSPQRPHRHTATEKRQHERTGYGRRGLSPQEVWDATPNPSQSGVPKR